MLKDKEILLREFPVKIISGFTKFTYALLKNENKVNLCVKVERYHIKEAKRNPVSTGLLNVVMLNVSENRSCYNIDILSYFVIIASFCNKVKLSCFLIMLEVQDSLCIGLLKRFCHVVPEVKSMLA